MSYDYPFARNMSTDVMFAKAYAEYTSSVVKNWEKFQAILAEVIENYEIYSSRADAERCWSEAVFADILEKYGYQHNQIICFNRGGIPILDLFIYICMELQARDKGIRPPHTDISFYVYDPDKPLNEMSNYPTYTYQLGELMDEIAGTYHAIVTADAVSNAYSLGKTIAEMISIIRDKVASVFSSAYVDLSNTLNDAIEFVKTGANIYSWVDRLLSKSGIDDEANSDEYVPFSNSEILTYTGVTPASAYAWDRVVDVLASTAKIACKAVQDLKSKLRDKAAQLFANAVMKVYHKAINPLDIEQVNVDTCETATVNGFCYQYVIAGSSSGYSVLRKKISKHGGIHFDMLPCEVRLLIGVEGNILVQMKFKPLDISTIPKFVDLFEPTPTNGVHLCKTVDMANFLTRLNRARGRGLARYMAVSGTYERDLYLGFIYGAIVTITMFDVLAQEAVGYDVYQYQPLRSHVPDRLFNILKNPDDYLPSGTEVEPVTNQYYFDLLATGNIRTPGGVKIPLYKGSEDVYLNYLDPVYVVDQVLMRQQQYPLKYSFWPYCCSSLDWLIPSFSLRSDQVNISEFSDWVDRVVVVTAVATAAIGSYVSLRRAATRALIRQHYKLLECSYKMQQGTLTNADLASFRRARLISSILGRLTGSLTSTSSVGLFSSAADATFDVLSGGKSSKESLSDLSDKIDDTFGPISADLGTIKQLLTG